MPVDLIYFLKFKNFCYYLNVDSNNEINEVEDTKNKSSKKLLYIFLAALLVFGLGYYFSMPTVLEQASENCDVPSGPFGFKIDEDGKGAYMDGAGEDDDYFFHIFTSDQVCILEELGAPSSVFSRIQNTNSLMGVQEAEWDNIKIMWTYHPSNGLDISVDLD